VKGLVSHCWKSTGLSQQLCVARIRLERKRDVTRITGNTCVIAWQSPARFLSVCVYIYIYMSVLKLFSSLSDP
jgi:hypothetical protein